MEVDDVEDLIKYGGGGQELKSTLLAGVAGYVNGFLRYSVSLEHKGRI